MSREKNKSSKNSAPKICEVCNDKATGVHFSVITCEGCKGFFRRSVQKKVSFVCLFDNKCVINKLTRKHCQACRFNACIKSGMKSELVMSDEAVNQKRELIRRNRAQKLMLQKEKEEKKKKRRVSSEEPATSEPMSVKMSMESKVLIEILLRSHMESYDFSYSEFESFRGHHLILTPGGQTDGDISFSWHVAAKGKEKSDVIDDEKTQKEFDAFDKVEIGNIFFGVENEKEKNNANAFRFLHGVSNSQIPEENSFKSSKTASNLEAHCNKLDNYIEENESEEASSSKKEQCLKSMCYFNGLLSSQGFSLEMIKDTKSLILLQHFCDIMSWGIRKVIEFCKKIPQFIELSIADQIALLKGGCLEMLVLRSYFAFSATGNTYVSNKFQYLPTDFIKAGASPQFIEKYNSLHLRMRKLKLEVEEVCLLLALVLFSPDRQDLNDVAAVEKMQSVISTALRSFEYTAKPLNKARNSYSEVLLILPELRTIKKLFSEDIESLQSNHEYDMNPLIFEINTKTPADKNN